MPKSPSRVDGGVLSGVGVKFARIRRCNTVTNRVISRNKCQFYAERNGVSGNLTQILVKQMNSTPTRFLVMVLVLMAFPFAKASAQQMERALNTPIIMHYYTAEQLQELAAADTNEFNSLVFYFTASFKVEPVECSDCIPFDSAMFDITRFEHLRHQDTVFVREFTKYGFRLTIYPVNSLPYQYAIHSVPRLDPGDKPKNGQQ